MNKIVLIAAAFFAALAFVTTAEAATRFQIRHGSVVKLPFVDFNPHRQRLLRRHDLRPRQRLLRRGLPHSRRFFSPPSIVHRGLVPTGRIVRDLRRRHFSNIQGLTLHGRAYKVRARDRYGRPVMLFIDPRTGRIFNRIHLR